mmetsp:Transcript_9402/g.14534  ORF Transcript_9402/g.14534 Transcript_9402/m.14534 type:complete len:505 (-) Transcript_9402:247-1761(-)
MAKGEYERGTPRGPISTFWRTFILCLIVFGSAFGVVSFTDQTDAVYLSMAGSMTSVVGLIYGSSAYGLAWNIITFVSTCRNEFVSSHNVTESLLLAVRSSLPFAIVQLSVMFAPSRLKMMFASCINTTFLSTLGAVFLLSIGPVVLLLCEEDNIQPLAYLSLLVGGMTVLLILIWHRNRSHRFLNLLYPEELGVSFLTAFVLTAVSKESVLPALTSSVTATCICMIFCATADVWYAVSTGQFWMIALDTLTGTSFILLPSIILLHRLNDQYGTFIFDKVQWLANVFNEQYVSNSGLEVASIGIPIFLGLIGLIGNVTIRSFCPLAAHLYGRVYIHGQPNTQKIAICILDWSNTGKQLLSKAKSLNLKVLLNFVVSYKELVEDTSSLREVIAAGHTIMPYTKEQIAHAKYTAIFSKDPEWSHGDSYPKDLICCSQKDTKIALWSHYCDGRNKPIAAALTESSGGAIVCLEQPVNSILELLEAVTKNGYSIAPISEVARKDPPMRL